MGSLSVLLWGCILPLVRLAIEQRGLLSTIIGIQAIGGISGLLILGLRGSLKVPLETFFSPFFFARQALFVSHVLCVYFAMSVVDRSAVPAVIFCNYLWPSLVLLYSIPIAHLRVPRPGIFAAGTALVIAALTLEFGWREFAELNEESGWGSIVLALFAANAWGAYSAITRRSGATSGGAVATPLFQLSCAIVGALLLFVRSEPVALGEVFSSPPILMAGALNFVAYLCWDIGIRRGNVVTLSLLADFIPWLSLAATSILLGVSIELITKVSAFILVFGALTTRIGTLEREKS